MNSETITGSMSPRRQRRHPDRCAPGVRRGIPVASALLPARLLCTLLCLTLCLNAGLPAQEASVRFSEANESYRAGDYGEAVRTYEAIVANGFESAGLYYNLGNAYYKLENIPAAVLNYERAKRLSPDDDDILYNLRIANLRVIDRIEPVPQLFFVTWWDAFLNLSSSAGWSTFGIAALWITVLLFAVFRVVPARRYQRAPVVGGVILICFAVLSFTAAFIQSGRESPGRAAIVFEPSVSVKSAPDGRSTDLFVIHEGVRVDLLDTVGEWNKIRLDDGKVGWLTRTTLREI